MRIHTAPLLLAFWIGILVPGATGDVLVLQNGRFLEGTVTERPAPHQSFQLERPEGILLFQAGDVKTVHRGVDIDSFYRIQEQTLQSAGADGYVSLARWCQKRGLEAYRIRSLTRALEIDLEHVAAHQLLGHIRHKGRWIPAEKHFRSMGLVQRGDTWSFPDPPPAGSVSLDPRHFEPLRDPGEVETAGTTLGKTIERYTATEDSNQRADLIVARTQQVTRLVATLAGSENSALRLAAARSLGQRGEVMSIGPLVRSACFDRIPAVRSAAVSSLLQVGYQATPLQFVPALRHDLPSVRLHALQAIGQFRDNPHAMNVLMKTIQVVHGGGPRANLFVGRQTAYIKDFDVQVASGAAIADPVIGVLQTGTVLDFQVLRIDEKITFAERRALFDGLRHVARVDLPNDARTWLAWWARNRPQGS